MKVGFAKWYYWDWGPNAFCRKLNEYKTYYSGYGVLAIQKIKNKLEFTKFQCGNGGIWGEACNDLAWFEDQLHDDQC